MTDKKAKDDLFSANDFFTATGINDQTRKKYQELGWIRVAVKIDEMPFYSLETIELARAMRRYMAKGLPIADAHELALHGRPLKERRIREAQGDDGETMDPRDVKTHPTFKNLLPLDKNLLERIADSMRHRHYFRHEPLVLAVWPGQKTPVLIDGHIRLEAAISEGIERVYFKIEVFQDEMAALQHAMSLQADRRTTDSGVQAKLIMTFDRLRQKGGDRRSKAAQSKTAKDVIEKTPPASSHITAALAGCSPSTVERFRRIVKEGSPRILNAVLAGKMKITTAHDKIVKKAQSTDKKESQAELSKEITRIVAALLKKKKLLETLRKYDGTIEEQFETALEMYVAYLEQDSHPGQD